MTVRVLAEGIHFGEGPRWHDGRLWFSDFYDHAVKTASLDGRVETMLEVAGQPSGLGWMPDGRLLVVSMHERQVLRLEQDRFVVHADLGDIATFHCNDMVVDAHGRAYVGNFGFDLDGETARRGFRSVAEDHTLAALAVVEPDGTARVAATDLDFPNGAVITPDGATLIVAETFGSRLTAFDVAADGSLSGRHVFADVAGRLPDGICLDAEGAVWIANAAAPECVRVSRGGRVLQVVETDQPCYACMLGGPNRRTLFMLTAATATPERAAAERTGHLLVTEVEIPGAGRP